MEAREGEGLTFTPKTNKQSTKVAIGKKELTEFYHEQLAFKKNV